MGKASASKKTPSQRDRHRQVGVMIKAILVFNNHGVPRLVKFYQRFEKQKEMITHLFIQISKRADSLCNFLLADPKHWGSAGNKIMYRHYATLYFVFVCD